MLAFTVAVAYMVSLFRFAESGFFSLNGGAAWLVIYGFALKLLIGVRLLMMVHCGERFDHGYNTLKKAFDGKKPDESTLNVGGSGGQACTFSVAPGHRNPDDASQESKKCSSEHVFSVKTRTCCTAWQRKHSKGRDR